MWCYTALTALLIGCGKYVVAHSHIAQTKPNRLLVVTARLRVVSTSHVTANTGGSINIAIQPDPSLGVRAWAGSHNGTVRVGIDKGVKRDIRTGTVKNQDQVEDPAFESKPVRVEVRATSGHGVVNIASIPNAPLPRPTPP